MKKIKSVVLPVTATALVLGTSGCGTGDDPSAEDQANDKLVGQWEITNADDYLYDVFFSNGYKFNFEFHLAGDAEFCILDENESYKICYLGEWGWTNTDYTQFELATEDIDISLDIDSFDGDEITGEMTLEMTYYGSSVEVSGAVTLERVYVDKSALKDAPAEMNAFKGLKVK